MAATGLQDARVIRKITAVLVVLCFWSLHSVAVIQAFAVDASFPIGLVLTYKDSTYHSSSTTRYHILRWVDNRSIVEINRDNELFNVSVADWRIVSGTGLGARFTQYPLWQNTSDWVLGRRLAIPDGGSLFRLQEYNYVQTCLGNTSSWRCLYRGTCDYEGIAYAYYVNLNYDCSLGLLTLVSERSYGPGGLNTSILTGVNGLSTGTTVVTIPITLESVLLAGIAIQALGLVLIIYKRRNRALQ